MNVSEFKSKYEKVPVKEYFNTVPEKVVVSVCVQTYQHADYIATCLDSILGQKTNFDFEILLGEDQSSDGTREICLKYAKKYPNKIRLYLHSRENNIKINGKPTGRFNLLNNIYSARGRYIAICEGDDYWTDLDKLQKQVDFLEKNQDYNITGHNVATLFPDGSTSKARFYTYPDGKYYLYKNFVPTLSLLFRNTDKLKNLPCYIEKTSMADFPISYFISDSKRVKKINAVMGVRRIHGGGVWSQLGSISIFDKGIAAREKMRPEIKEEDIPYLNSGINRLKLKRYLMQKANGDSVSCPELYANAKYLKFHKLFLFLGRIISNKKVLDNLNKICEYIVDYSLTILKK